MLQLQTIVPRSVLVFYPVLLIFIMAGDRFAYRMWKEHRLYSSFADLGEPVLIVGAGEAGARLTGELGRSRQWRVVGLRRRRSGQARPAAARPQGAGDDRVAAAWAQALRRAQGDHRDAVGRARRAPARGRGLRRRRAGGADGAFVRGARSAAARTSPRSATSSSTTCSAATRWSLDNAGLREWLGNRVRAGHRRRRLDRRGAVPPDRALPAGAAGAVRHLGVRALRDPDQEFRRRLPAAAAGLRRRRRQARVAHRRPCSRASARRSSSTPRPTSTCR